MKIPERYLAEYNTQLNRQFKGRTALFILTGTSVFFLVSFFYLARYLIFKTPDTFNPRELLFWIGILVSSTALFTFNARTSTPKDSKIYGLFFNFFLLIMIFQLAFLYPTSALVFPCFIALALMFIALTIPWSIPELIFITAVYGVIFSVFAGVMYFVFRYPVASVPRFHFYFDGLLFILIVAGLCILLRKKQQDLDIRNFLLLKEVEEKNTQIQKDLEFANRIHRTLIPDSIATDRADIAVTYQPASYVGGDYAKFHFAKNDTLIFFIGDVTGHGVASALMVNRIHAEFERLAKEYLKPGELLNRLNEFIHADFTGTGMYLSAFCGMLDFKNKRFIYSNYGHPPQYLFRRALSQITPLAAQTTLLGITHDGVQFEHELLFENGDRIFIFTDGITEALSP